MKEFNPKEIINDKADNSSLINSLIEEIRNDKEVYEIIKSLNLTNREVRENVGKLHDFKVDYNYCKHCPGIENCSKEIPHISMFLIKENSFISTSYEPCKKIISKMQINSKYLINDFPDEWKESTLKKIDLSALRKPIVVEFSKILRKNSDRWIYLTGNHKIGKSFLLVTFANEFIAMNLGQVAVVNSANVIKKLADLSINNNDEFLSKIDSLSNVSLLIFDDFGEEYKSEYVRDQIILPILSNREHNGLLTFFSSDFTIDEIRQMYSIGKNSGEIRGKQLGKLLNEMCGKEFNLTGASIYRKK